MADEKKVDKEQSADNEKVVEEEKQSNKTYTQSDFDKEVARQLAEHSLKYKDYDLTKKELEELKTWKQEKENAELSEAEKMQKMVEEQKSQLESLQTQNKELSLSVLKGNILSGSEFMGLPKAYKMMVQGESEEEIKVNATKALEEWQSDLSKLGKSVDTPSPKLNKEGGKAETTFKNPAEAISEGLKNRFSQSTV